MTLYIPTSSLNFNDFLAIESICPKTFYAVKGFGTKRHFTTELSINNDYITLYSKIPPFSFLEDSKLEQYPIIIKVELKKEDSKLIEINKGIFLYSGTIYFNEKTKFLVQNKDEHNKILNKAKFISETKLYNKYLNKIEIVSDSKFIINLEYVNDKYKSLVNPIKESEIEKDFMFNCIKGFYYSYYYSNPLLINKTKIEIENQFAIYELENCIKSIEKYSNKSNKTILKNFIKSKNELIETNIKETKKTRKNILFNIDNEEINFNSYNIEFDSENEFKVFNLIINNILKLKKELKSISLQLIEQLIKSIAYNIKDNSYNDKKKYIEDLQLIYKRIIKHELGLDIKDLKSNIMQNFYATILKYDNILEFSKILRENNIKNNFLGFGLYGLLNGFSSIEKGFLNIDTSKQNQLIDMELNLQYNNLICMYEKIIYKNIECVKKISLLEKILKNKEKLLKEKNISLKFKVNEKFSTLIINDSYIIRFYRNISKNKFECLKFKLQKIGLNITINKRGKYKYFEYYTLNKKPLNTQQEEDFSAIVQQLVNI